MAVHFAGSLSQNFWEELTFQGLETDSWWIPRQLASNGASLDRTDSPPQSSAWNLRHEPLPQPQTVTLELPWPRVPFPPSPRLSTLLSISAHPNSTCNSASVQSLPGFSLCSWSLATFSVSLCVCSCFCRTATSVPWAGLCQTADLCSCKIAAFLLLVCLFSFRNRAFVCSPTWPGARFATQTCLWLPAVLPSQPPRRWACRPEPVCCPFCSFMHMIQFSCQLHFSFSSFEIVTLFSARFLDMFFKRHVGPSSLTSRRAHGTLLLHLREKRGVSLLENSTSHPTSRCIWPWNL